MRQSPRQAQGSRNPQLPGPVATGPASVPPNPRRTNGSHNAAIDHLVLSLERKHNLGLKPREKTWSPKKRDRMPQGAVETTADRVVSKITLLFFKSRENLDLAIENFESVAKGFEPDQRLGILHGSLKAKTDQITRNRRITPDDKPFQVPPSSQSSSHVENHKILRSTPLLRKLRDNLSEPNHTAVENAGSPTDEEGDEYYTPSSPTTSGTLTQRRVQTSAHFHSRSTSRKRPSDGSTSGKSPKLTQIVQNELPSERSFIKAPSKSVPKFEFKRPYDMNRSFQPTATAGTLANTSFNNSPDSSEQTQADTVNTSFASIDGAADKRQAVTRTTSTTIRPCGDQDLFDVVTKFEAETSQQQGVSDYIHNVLQHHTRGSSSKFGCSTFGSIDDETWVNASTAFEANYHLNHGYDSRQMNQNESHAVVGQTGTGSSAQVTHMENLIAANPPLDPMSKPVSLENHIRTCPSRIPYYVRDLPHANLFVKPLSSDLHKLPYFLVFICSRISIAENIPLSTLIHALNPREVISDRDAFWKPLEQHVRSIPKESKSVWAAAARRFDGFTFKGNIAFNAIPSSTKSVFKLESLTIQPEKSCLFQRKYGSDRFLYMDFPSFSGSKPDGLKSVDIERHWKSWLMQPHSAFGRTWRVFHLETLKKKQSFLSRSSADKRVILFATEGLGIDHPMSVCEAYQGFIDLRKNSHQSYCKLASRIDLGLSKTTPTIVFKPSQIKFVRDLLSDGPIEASEFNDASLDWSEQSEPGQVMNDGCARISVGAAQEVWKTVRKATGLEDPLPSALQGRIGGAKGMWMISDEPHTTDPYHLDIWIEVSDSQLKFIPADDDLADDRPCDSHRLTFNYLKHSCVNGSTDLHIAFISILVDRGVPRDVVEEYVKGSLERGRNEVLKLPNDCVRLHNWVTKLGFVTPVEGILPRQAALPISLVERIKMLLRAGFSPSESPFLARELRRLVEQQHLGTEKKLRVPLGNATFLFGLADPTGMLRPGEVHVHFSTPFSDEQNGQTYRHLNNLEVLVARQPACRRSDVQKMRAISHLGLSHLVDVVVFPTQGQYPAAGKLQGGDYDGDIFWICWEPSLVKPFRNAPAPLKALDPAAYGIKQDKRRLDQLMNLEDLSTFDNFLEAVFDFRLVPSQLGKVTNLLEKVAYYENRIHSPRLVQLSDLHDLLVDASKQGYRFDEMDFNKLTRHKLRCGQLNVPAYKVAMEWRAKSKDNVETERNTVHEAQYNADNLLDYFYFGVVVQHNEETRALLKQALSKNLEDDPDLQYPFVNLNKHSSTIIKEELNCIKRRLKNLADSWNHGLGDRAELQSEQYKKLLEDCFTIFKSLHPSPANISHPDIAPLIQHYRGAEHPTIWDTIKASALYLMFPTKHVFVWHMAGMELASIKADKNIDVFRVVPAIFADLKTKPNKVPRSYEEEESDDEFQSALEVVSR